MSLNPSDPETYLAGRKSLVKALHTVTTVSRLAVYLIESEKFTVKQPEPAVRKALSIIGQDGGWKDSDPVFVKSVEATIKKLAAKEK